jgi:Tfp pilus assembly protein PilF
MKYTTSFFIVMSCAFFFIACKQKPVDRNTLDFKQKQVAAITQLLSEKPDSVGLRLILANELDSIGQYRRALLQMDTLIENDSDKYALWLIKANMLLDSGDTVSAKENYRKAISIYPGNEALVGLTEILADEKNDSSLVLAQQFNRENKYYTTYIAGLYAAKTGDAEKGLILLDSCLLQNHQFIKPYLAKGNIYLTKGDASNALLTYKKGLDMEPQNILLLNAVGKSYKRLGKGDSAKTYFAKSLLEQPFQPVITEDLKTLNVK